MELNEQSTKVLDLLKDNKSVFITGRAGTGKSTLISYYRQNINPQAVFLASTGVSALNIAGETIHRFFGFSPRTTLTSIIKRHREPLRADKYKMLKTIVIDEVSMVRADLLDMVDQFLRIYGPAVGSPFGGVQMIFVGDLYQLPPVVTKDDQQPFNAQYDSPYFFSSNVIQNSDFKLHRIELKQVYRQEDGDFLNILNSVRTGNIPPDQLKTLNKRCLPYKPLVNGEDPPIILTTLRKTADKINTEKLNSIDKQAHQYIAEIGGTVPKSMYPVDELIVLKQGSRVMTTHNCPLNTYANGSIGTVVSLTDDNLDILFDEGTLVKLSRSIWEIKSYESNGISIQAKSIGMYSQFPIRLAYAITIHKSQGMTYDAATLDFGNGAFCHGQTYVALSRVKSLTGIYLNGPLTDKDIFCDERVKEYMNEFN